jgi:HSP20 family molecular chaperone IbpA
MGTSLFDVFFDSDFYSFNRLVRDKRPYQVVNNEGSSTIIHGIVGINPEDVKIEINPLKIQSRFTVKHNDVDKITKKVKNGILYLTVKWKQQEKPQIEILEE